MGRATLALAVVGFVVLFSRAQCTTTTPRASDYSYQVETFYTGEHVKQLTIHTSDGQLISAIEVPAGVFLSIYADKRDAGMASTKDWSPFDRTGKTVSSQFSGRISIRAQLAKNLQEGQPAPESMIHVPLRLDLDNAIVKVVRD